MPPIKRPADVDVTISKKGDLSKQPTKDQIKNGNIRWDVPLIDIDMKPIAVNPIFYGISLLNAGLFGDPESDRLNNPFVRY